MRSLVSIATFLAFSLTVFGQEPGVYTQYYVNPILLNPGAAGFSGEHEFIFNYRNQWAAFDGSARDFTFQYDGMVGDRIGIGAQLFMERVGRFRNFQGTLQYAYQIQSDDLKLSVGLSTGIQQLRLSSEADPFVDETDELLNEALDGVFMFDASIGAYGVYNDALIFGVSFPNLVRTRLANIQGDIEDPNEEFNYAALLGYRFKINDYNFVVEPSIAVKNIRRVPFHVDLNLKLSFLEEQLVGGLTYSISEDEISRVGFLLGTRLNSLRIYYGYDVSLGDFQDFNNGSHELTIKFSLPRKASTEAPAEE